MVGTPDIFKDLSVKVVLIYLGVSLLWVLFTDQMLAYWVDDPAVLTNIQTWKGWFFVLASSALLFWLIRRFNRKTIQYRNQLKSMMDNAGAGILRLRNGRIIECNRTFGKLLGYENSVLTGTSFADYLSDKDLGNLDKIENEVKRRLRNQSYNVQLVHRDGSLIHVQLILSGLGEESSEFLDLIVVDSSGWKYKYEAKSKVEESLNLALESVDMATWDFDVQSRTFTTSSQHNELLGLDKDVQLSIQTVMDAVHEEDYAGLRKAIGITLLQGTDLDIEYRVKLPNGKKRWIWSLGKAYRQNGKVVRVTGVITDITHRKRLEEKLSREEELYSKIIDNIPVMISIYNPNISEFTVNREYERITGWTNKAIQSVDLFEEAFPDKKQREEIAEFMKNPDGSWKDMEMTIRSGEKIQTTWTNVRLSDNTQIGIGLDITERKKYEEELKNSEARARESKELLLSTFESLEPAVLVLNKLSREIIECNPAVESVFEYTREEVIGNTTEFLHVDEEHSLMFHELSIDELMEKGTFQGEFVMKKKNGEVFISEHSVTLVLDEKGDIDKVVSVVSDITDRKRAENELRENEFLLREAQRVSNFGTFRLNLVTGEAETSSVLKKIFGIQPGGELNLQIWEEALHPDHHAMVTGELENVVKDGSRFEKEYKILRRSDGEVRWLHGVGEPEFNDEGETEYMIGTIRDITERKELDLQLREYQHDLEESQRIANLGTYRIHLESGNATGTDILKSIFGFGPDHDLHINDWENMIHPVHKERVLNYYDEVISEKKQFEIEYKIVRANDQSTRWVYERAELELNENGEPISMVGVAQDITERKMRELQLRESRQRLLNAQEIARLGYWALTLNGLTFEWSEMTYRLFGLDEEKGEPGYKDFLNEIVHPDDRDRLERSFRTCLKEGSEEIIYRIVRPDGEEVVIQGNAELKFDGQGRKKAIAGTVMDITNIKLVEKELEEERKKFEVIARSTNDVLYDWNVGTDHVWWNDGWVVEFGFNRDNVEESLKWWENIIASEDRERVIENLKHSPMDSLTEWKEEYSINLPNGEQAFVVDQGYYLRNSQGDVERLLGSIRNVTAERKAQQYLKESEQQYRLLFEQNPYPMYIFNPKNFRFVEVNDAAVGHYGYSRDEFLSMTILELRPAEDIEKVKKAVRETEDGKMRFQIWRHKKKDGSIRTVEISASNIDYFGNTYRLIVVNDITEQKKAEDRIIGSIIEGSEQERKRIAKELHDSLGQYLSAANMNLESVYEELQEMPGMNLKPYEKGLNLLKDAIVESRRISQNLLPKAIEDFGLSMAVQSLVGDLTSSYDIEIDFRETLGETKLKEHSELNIYRIIQEALNNAIYHSSCTRIDIQLNADDDQKELICTIEDDGVGFVPDEQQKGGLGMSNMQSRTNALGGVLEISSEKGKGTLISVIVPLKIV